MKCHQALVYRRANWGTGWCTGNPADLWRTGASRITNITLMCYAWGCSASLLGSHKHPLVTLWERKALAFLPPASLKTQPFKWRNRGPEGLSSALNHRSNHEKGFVKASPPLPFFSACKISFSWKKAASPSLPLRYLSLGNGRASAGWGRGEARSAPTAPSEAWKLSFVNAEIPPRILQWQIIVTRIIKLQRQGHLSWLFAKQSTFPPSSLALARLRGLSCLATYRQRSPCPHCCQSKPKLPRDVRGEKCTWACSILPGTVCQGNRKAITPA